MIVWQLQIPLFPLLWLLKIVVTWYEQGKKINASVVKNSRDKFSKVKRLTCELTATSFYISVIEKNLQHQSISYMTSEKWIQFSIIILEIKFYCKNILNISLEILNSFMLIWYSRVVTEIVTGPAFLADSLCFHLLNLWYIESILHFALACDIFTEFISIS